MHKILIGGEVVGGKFKPLNQSLFRRAFAEYEGKKCLVAVKKFENSRTVQQNRYMYGVVFQIISDYSGSSIEEVHDRMCQMFLPPIVTENEKIGCFIAQGKTSKLTTGEMADFLERCRAFGASLGLEIPLPPYRGER